MEDAERKYKRFQQDAQDQKYEFDIRAEMEARGNADDEANKEFEETQDQ